jgi:HAD superfamily hydrolase (TIGR01490 family)
MNIVFFDFDGTLTTRDSFTDFIIYARGYVNFLVGVLLLSPVLISYKLKITPNWRAKEKVLGYFFGGWQVREFQDLASRYARERLPQIIRESALQKIYEHRAAGDKVAVVTAAFDSWLQDWCAAHGLDLLATQLETKNGRLTGRILGKNCYGPEKVRRIQERYNLADFSRIYAYGDSPGDEEMLALADCAWVSGKRIR